MRCLAAAVLIATSAFAAPPAAGELPPALREWVPWVLHHEKTGACPFLHGDATRVCAWPARLQLVLDDKGGRFTQSFALYGEEAWLPLPGAARRWPQNVKVDGRPAIVVAGPDARPVVLLTPGNSTVTGDFQWDSLPESLEIPNRTALLALTLKGQSVQQPNRDSEGRVFLQRDAAQAAETDHLEIDVHRLVTDEIPLTLTTRVSLKVAGRSREVLLGRALPPGFVPMSLTGSLPVRVESDGRVRVQARPGTWQLELTARSEGPVAALSRPPPDGPWVEGDEVWVFSARPSLRQVLVEGVNAVDPTQTTLPPEWRSFPAYAVGLEDSFKLSERRRGDSDPAPDVLNLNRTLWLDFDGKGYTVSDKLNGQLHRSWRLDVQPGTDLGRVVASGADQSITRLDTDGHAGVELRQGALALEADSRLAGDISDISAVSWNADFNSVRATLHVPPGWKLLAARGADDVPATWFNQWTLLDLFLVLIIAVAVARLFGTGYGLLAALTLLLAWQEDDVPQFAWLVALAAEAIHRVLPKGTVKTLLWLTRGAALAVLVLLTVAFAVQHVRAGMYPSLSREMSLGGVQEWNAYNLDNQQVYARSEGGDGLFDQLEEKAYEEYDGALSRGSLSKKKAPQAPMAQQQVQQQKRRSYDVRDFDKNATVQTGPGLPRWEWQPVSISFSGPVQRDQRLSFIFLGPGANFVLAFVRVILLSLLLLLLLGFPGGFWPTFLKRAVKGAAPAAALWLALLASPAFAQSTPSNEVLEQLRTRLTEKPSCAPSCASSPRLLLEATPKVLRLRFEVLAGAQTAVPLPGSASQWVPDTVLLDGRPASAVRRGDDGLLWLAVGPGAHQVQLEGALPGRATVQVALPLRAYRVEAKLDGWTLDGLHEDGVADDNLQLSRKATGEKDEGGGLQAGVLPPFVRVERTLVLGLQWTVETTLTRVTPTGSAVVLEVPLLPGESVTSSDVRVTGGKALVNMSPNAVTQTWTSVLEAKAPIQLTAPEAVPWTEVWRLDISPVWHATLSGIPVVHQQDDTGARLPEWRPWPGERVTVDVSRPEALRGQTMTIDQSSLSVSPGTRATDVVFTANLRSSRGGLHAFTLPEGAALQDVTLNGVQQPIRQEGRAVSIPLSPGSQSVQLKWREGDGVGFNWRTPDFNLGTPGVNADVEVRLPYGSRWVLLVTGPGAGPAVLFWSFLLVLLAVSIALGRAGYTPLKVYHWVLLALGLSQVPMPAIGFVFAWLLLLGWREKVDLTPGWFQLRQLAVVGVTFIALIILGASVYEGLLGQPEMQVQGNGSSATLLRWFSDRVDGAFPRATVISVPMLVYRGAMLAWSLWMALSLVAWLKWGWKAFATFGLWKSPPPRPPSPPPAPKPAP